VTAADSRTSLPASIRFAVDAKNHSGGNEEIMSIKKEYLKARPVCRVTFRIAGQEGNGVQKAQLVGEFNNWSPGAHPMKRMKNGAFTATLELPVGREYQFRYLLDADNWQNDSAADKFVPTPFGDCKNSVVVL
jgi:Glycogen recognition site of AMP-activated protein kinase